MKGFVFLVVSAAMLMYGISAYADVGANGHDGHGKSSVAGLHGDARGHDQKGHDRGRDADRGRERGHDKDGRDGRDGRNRSHEIAALEGRIAAQKAELAAQKSEIAALEAKVAADNATIAADNATIAADNAASSKSVASALRSVSRGPGVGTVPAGSNGEVAVAIVPIDEGIAGAPYAFSLYKQNWVGESSNQLIEQMGTPSSTETFASGNTTYDYNHYDQDGTKSGSLMNTRSVFNIDSNGVVTSEYVVIL